MATGVRNLRRGLPRVPGGEPWPPQGDVPGGSASVVSEAHAGKVAAAAPVAPEASAAPAVPEAPVVEAPAASVQEAAATVSSQGRRLRSGLPRVPGGPPWPEAGAVAAAPAQVADVTATPLMAVVPEPVVAEPAEPAAVPAESAASAPQPATAAASSQLAGRPLRRGLPRVAGGEAWPPAGGAPAAPAPAPAEAPATEKVVPAAAHAPEAPAAAASVAAAPAKPAAPEPVQPAPSVEPAAPAASAPPAAAPPRVPAAQPAARATAPASAPAAAATSAAPAKPEARKYGRLTLRQWVGASVVGVLALIGLATIVVSLTRWFIGLEFMQDFMATYPGETHLPEGAPVGLPAWLGWQHFFNAFLIVLIIRSGWQVRTEQRPPAYWTPRWSKDGKRRISLNLWFHQSLDLLWFANGVIFVILLFATGQWMRVVPTSWEIVPNAISAGLQYLSLDWPLENGWVNYNSLQVLAYFVTIFIAAPLAALTGVRMSGLWPKQATTLSRIYPVEWARAVHFPVMLYFVAFIVVHVALVFLTGALRNLNHMYTARDAGDWLGFLVFVVSVVVIAAAWIAARPSVLAPIAGLFGKVGR